MGETELGHHELGHGGGTLTLEAVLAAKLLAFFRHGNTAVVTGIGALGGEIESFLDLDGRKMVIDLVGVRGHTTEEMIRDVMVIVFHLTAGVQAGVVLAGDQLQQSRFTALRRADDAANMTGSEHGRDVAQNVGTSLGIEGVNRGGEGRADRLELTGGDTRFGRHRDVAHGNLDAFLRGHVVSHLHDLGVTQATDKTGCELDKLGGRLILLFFDNKITQKWDAETK